jgi:hypothetical protein
MPQQPDRFDLYTFIAGARWNAAIPSRWSATAAGLLRSCRRFRTNTWSALAVKPGSDRRNRAVRDCGCRLRRERWKRIEKSEG